MATNFVSASYQEIIDFSTTADKLSVVAFHAPTGDRPYKMLKGFFEQFQKYKYLGCSVSGIQPAQLPADPLQVSYEAGEQTIDPRDMLNPLLFKGVHGETLDTVLDSIYTLGGFTHYNDSASENQFDASADNDNDYYDVYYTWMTSNKFRKMSPTNGFRLSMYPLTWQTSTLQPIPTSTNPLGFPNQVNAQAGIGEYASGDAVVGGSWTTDGSMPGTDGPGSMFFVTSGAQRLGWIPTRQRVLTAVDTPDNIVPDDVSIFSGSSAMNTIHECFNPLPRLFMGVLIFPPANKILWSYRMIITHRFMFKGFSTAPAQDLSWNTSLSGSVTDPEVTGGVSLGDPAYTSWLSSVTTTTASVDAVNSNAVTKIDSVS